MFPILMASFGCGGDQSISETPRPRRPATAPVEPVQPVDSDGDGVPDNRDNCLFTANSGQGDADLDGIGDACDNCTFTANRPQTDVDANGWGDACETPGPDVLILTFSGHDVTGGAYSGHNLDLPGGMGPALADLFTDARVWGYSDQLYSYPNGCSPQLQECSAFGFTKAWNDSVLTFFDWQYDAEGFLYERPTRIIVVGHSHGTNWSHLLVNELVWLEVDLLIDVDGISSYWESEGSFGLGDDWANVILDYEESSVPWSRTFSNVTSNWNIPGAPLLDEKDVFGSNVALNLEVWSDGLVANGGPWSLVTLADGQLNYASDGSLRSRSLQCTSLEAHTTVDNANSFAHWWIESQVVEFYGGPAASDCQ